jgi:hypothetical protein
MVRLRDDIDSIVVAMPFELREAFMAADQQAYYLTDHYLRYPWMLVRLSAIKSGALEEILQISYDMVAGR